MPKAESSSDASDQEDITHMLEMGGEMDIDYFLISSPSLTSFYLEVGGKICAGFDIGWVSAVRIRLYHRTILVGEVTSPETALIPDSNNYVKTEWDDIRKLLVPIKNMVAFRNFFAEIMPRASANDEPNVKKQPTAALEVSPNGHRLTMSIDLANMPRMSTKVNSLEISHDKININMTITNPSPLSLWFEVNCNFVLKKGQDIIGELMAPFDIKPGEEVCVFVGTIRPRTSGMVTIKGEKYEDVDYSWQQYIMKLFEVEINLDEFIVKTNGNDK
ncbi:hypothetical protein CFAM422_007079 [Trichoderma lentiforme]|uniref:Uncharacterized protein n=1 Tax=Trichoderma lentiforme TaxID=1567552 RepID=A0A9P4XDW4_9HYPO|nr:hypothetical protein CFAM422_007079 [Trichoderma lentiforme]